MKQMNDYANLIDAEIYIKTPKAVFAAIAVSFANQISADELVRSGNATKAILDEWLALYNAQIVLQKPVKKGRGL